MTPVKWLHLVGWQEQDRTIERSLCEDWQECGKVACSLLDAVLFEEGDFS